MVDEWFIFVTISTETFVVRKHTHEICINNELKWGSAHTNLFCIWVVQYDPIVFSHWSASQEGHEQNPLALLSVRGFPPAAVTADTQGDGLNY